MTEGLKRWHHRSHGQDFFPAIACDGPVATRRVGPNR
jgi:hypothetical protein